MTSSAKKPVGWRLVAAVFAVDVVVVAAVLAIDGVTERALSATLRATAIAAMSLFLLAFTASSLHRLWPSDASKWLLRNRRYLGVSFAVTHIVHLGLIGTRVGLYSEAFWTGRTAAGLIPGATAYLFILLMTVTSFDGPTRALGRAKWKVLHKTGSYVIWAIFVGAEAGRLKQSGLHAIPLAVLAAALAVRAAARLRIMRRKRATPVSPSSRSGSK